MAKNLSNHHKNPCANCGHRDMHGEVAGCIALASTNPERWCDCTEYVDPQPAQVARTIPARRSDPGTSHGAAAAVTVKANNQRGILLAAFGATADPEGLTDEQAMEASVGVSPTSEYAKRCSELRDAGLIQETGGTRMGNAGRPRIVSAITDAGRQVLASL